MARRKTHINASASFHRLPAIRGILQTIIIGRLTKFRADLNRFETPGLTGIMRLIQATVSSDVLPNVQERGIDYFVTHEFGPDKYAAVVYVSIADETVESVLGDLCELGLDSDDHVVIVESEDNIFQRPDGQASLIRVKAPYGRVPSDDLGGSSRLSRDRGSDRRGG